MRRSLGSWSLLAAVVGGCATAPPLPPELWYELGPERAHYRAYAAGALCAVRPEALERELGTTNSLLAFLLDNTAADHEGYWTDEQLGLLDRAEKTLTPVLDVHATNLTALEGCDFGDEDPFPDLLTHGHEFVRQARRRVQTAPPLIAYVKARRAREQWKLERPGREAQGKQACPPALRAPTPYYAWQDEAGTIRVLFCDGAQVVRGAGDPTFDPPPKAPKKVLKRLRPKRYLEAAAALADTGVDRPPALPPYGVAEEAPREPTLEEEAQSFP